MKLFIDSKVAPTRSNFNTSSASQLKNSSILDGSEVYFKCETDANPNDVQIKWFINDTLVVGDYTTEMVNISFYFTFAILFNFFSFEILIPFVEFTIQNRIHIFCVCVCVRAELRILYSMVLNKID